MCIGDDINYKNAELLEKINNQKPATPRTEKTKKQALAGIYLKEILDENNIMPNRENALENYLKIAKSNVPDHLYLKFSEIFREDKGSKFGSVIISEHQEVYRT